MIRIGLSGCGAVSERYYVPALQALQAEGRGQLVAAFDPDHAALASICGRLPGAQACRSYAELLAAGPELILVASPPRWHAGQAAEALAKGVAVHCEKPLAMSAEEAATMIAAAHAARRPLTEGLVRRQFPAVRAIADLLERGVIGPLASVEVFEGGPFDWPVSSPAYFSRAESGGGVLRDLGPHVFDLLIGWLGEPELVAYQDDAQGGVEVNAQARLAFGDVAAKVRFSRDWSRPNRFVFQGAAGRIVWTSYETDRLELILDGAPFTSTLLLEETGGGPAADFQGAFTNQLRLALEGIGRADAEGSPLDPGVGALRLIDLCYARRAPLSEPWLVNEQIA
ncbi:Gfo/Idh/MocA family oxidoreductase [Phenylobacterium sp.]|uniref:Gfo/Idh/MocA family protein n=1 Tax=Phenylobacterium sp. TaxID=1871053 RepID=UPI0028976859|nr:Gfo/Idh/MocA family oxidoreductase [Phenylobacterium sp.]